MGAKTLAGTDRSGIPRYLVQSDFEPFPFQSGRIMARSVGMSVKRGSSQLMTGAPPDLSSSADRMYPLTTTIQYLRRNRNERGYGRMGEWNQHRREDGDEPETRRRYNTARWDQGRLGRTCGKG